MVSGIDSIGAGVISIKKILSSPQAFLIYLCSLFSVSGYIKCFVLISGYTKTSVQVHILVLTQIEKPHELGN